MTASRQTTLARSISLSGVGVHSGQKADISIHPSDPDSGYLFFRQDEAYGERWLEARREAVTATEFQTVLADEFGPLVGTVEHVLAALRGMGIDNAVIEVDGPEVPILDGSAAPYVRAIEEAGLKTQAMRRRYLKVLKPIRVDQGRGYGELRPCNSGFHLDVEIEFANPLVGTQRWAGKMDSTIFSKDVARARTFGFMRDVARLWGQNFARGASLENTIVVADDRILNPEGLRYRDEFVRHKVLDAIGDLALAGLPLMGSYMAKCPGHKLNAAMMDALFADSSAWSIVTDTVEPRRERSFADLVGFIPSPAFAPDLH